MSKPCITVAMWEKATAEGHDLATAQGRAAFDRTLRKELAEISDPSLRSNAAEILKQERAVVFPDIYAEDMRGILARLPRIEDALGISRGNEAASQKEAKGNT